MSRRITRGDAEAVLNAFGTGGRVILANGHTAEAAPADFQAVTARSGHFRARRGMVGTSAAKTGTSSWSRGSTAGTPASTTSEPQPPSTR